MVADGNYIQMTIPNQAPSPKKTDNELSHLRSSIKVHQPQLA